MSEFGIVLGPDLVDPQMLEDWILSAIEEQEHVRECLHQRFGATTTSDMVDEFKDHGRVRPWSERVDGGRDLELLLRFGVEETNMIEEALDRVRFADECCLTALRRIAVVHSKLKHAQLRASIGSESDLIACRDELRAIVLPKNWFSGTDQRVLVSTPIEQLVSLLADDKVITLPNRAAIYDGWVWIRTSREKHLSGQEFCLAVKEAVERERRRFRSLEQRHSTINVKPPQIERTESKCSDSSNCTPEGRSAIEQNLASASPHQFEHIVAQVLEAAGLHEVWVTPHSGDQGVDVRAYVTVSGVFRIPIAVQAKHLSGSVHAPVVREFRGSLQPGEVGIIMTTGDFSAGAVDEATRPGYIPITLVGRKQLIELIGVLGVTW